MSVVDGAVKLLRAIALLLAAVIALAAPPLSAHETAPTAQPDCFAHSGAEVSLDRMVANDPRWSCAHDGWNASAPVSWIRFDRASWSGQGVAPRFFFTRISRFASITLAAIDEDGTIRSANYAESDGRPVAAGPIFTLPLPTVSSKTRAVIVRIDGPHSAPMITEARLTTSTDRTDWGMTRVIMLAVILGMLITPLIFDVNFYLVLRERFVLLHAYMALAMALYVLFAGGLLPLFLSTTVAAMAIGGALSWAVGVAVSAFFMRAFLEKGALPRLLDRVLAASGWWTLIVIGFAALQLRWTQSFDNTLYFYAFVPVIAIYLVAIVTAVRNGSRAARFVAAAWIPLIMAAVERLLRGLGVYAAPSFFDQMLYVALALEVVVVALGVADKYLAIRHDRDNARAEARILENLSERDPLTGLLNRRALDDRFDQLVAEGYHTVALFDLDHFKRVNDTHGHEVGDKVLGVVADVLRGDGQAMAVRMGGEEFLVLLAGADSENRAEKLRQMIPVRVAREVGELSAILTASVGLVHMPPEAKGKADFADVYRRADALLYEAKEAGRNLLASETLRLPPPADNVTQLALG